MIAHSFGESEPWSLGIEEELMLLAGDTLELAPAVDAVLPEAEGLELPGRLKTEVFASMLELNTRRCASVEEAVAAVSELRAVAAHIARKHGLSLAAAGTHPISRPEEQAIVEEARYVEFVRYAGVSARRQGVNGLHVHVGMPSPAACFHALEGVLPWLPVVLALSANSPYLAGEENGLLSNRADVLAQLPRSGAPPAFTSYADWESFVERLVRLGVTADYTRLWWDVRLHPRFGTLEIRMPDQPTSLELVGAFTALLQALCVTMLRQPPPPYRPGERGVYQQNRWAALRFGPDAELVHPDGDRVARVPELAAELLELVERAAGELGAHEFLVAFDSRSCEAHRQLDVGRAEGLRAVCADLVARTA